MELIEVAEAKELTLMEEAQLNTRIFTKEELIDITYGIADEHSVSRETMQKVVECESNYVVDAVGDHGYSHGLVQIHSPSHPSVTLEQANNPHYALTFLAEHLKMGKGYLWTCYRMFNR